jgi:uncharacterized protein DUF1592/uncharacterized protein DUF1588/uncharacterized protein DUF1587/uncharacterized protein DUF1595/uncharacterized protein DUF1585
VKKSLLCYILGASAAVATAAETTPFSKTVYPAFAEAGCRNCHTSDGVASATRLHFPDAGATVERTEAFGKSLVKLVNAQNPAASLLLQKPTNRVPHAGGQKIVPGSPEETALRAWIDRLAAMKGEELAAATRYSEEEGERPTVGIRRLTHSQYNNTVRDLLGDRSLPATQFPPEDFVGGFKNQYTAQNLSPLLQDAYSTAAEKLARRAIRNEGLIPCQPSAACRTQFIQGFGLKAYRRPLEPVEVRRYEALFQKAGNFTAGAQLVMEIMLQSSNFLFRLEDTANAKWKPYAAASRLSYALWDSMPDEALFAAAARGELNTREGVEKTVRRMLADTRAKEALDEFSSQWLRFDRGAATTKDRRAFPQFNPGVALAMTEEARRFVADLVWNDRNFTELFTAEYGYMNGDLARIYKVEPPAVDFERVSFPADSERAGLLGQALFLATSAKPDDTSPTARGLFVREQFLCQHVPDPPAGVDTNLPPVTEAKPMANRDRLSMHTTNKSCAGCHTLVDPIGFGFEKFDAIGQRRDKLKLTFTEGERRSPNARSTTVEVDLDTKGQVAGIPNSAFASPKQLAAVLANSPQCQECIVRQYFRYVAGRSDTNADKGTIRKIFEDFRKSGFKFKDMMISMMVAREFPPRGGVASVQRNH